jgi:hypothetical protein
MTWNTVDCESEMVEYVYDSSEKKSFRIRAWGIILLKGLVTT